MNKNVAALTIAVLLVGGIGLVVFLQSNQEGVAAQTITTAAFSTPAPAPTPTPVPAPTPTSTSQINTSAGGQQQKSPDSFTLADVAKHGNTSSCWSAINGGVYDLTNWIAQHPGGEGTILSICGKDGSAAFNGQHGGQGKPERILATFRIGTLQK